MIMIMVTTDTGTAQHCLPCTDFVNFRKVHAGRVGRGGK